MTTLTSDLLISEITNELTGLPYAQRMAAVRAYEKLLEENEDEAAKLRYAWPLHARDSQLPPEGDWDTWLILAGRGFGKTRTGAEWVRAQVEDRHATRIALVARTLPEAQSIMIEGESGIINISSPWDKPTYEPSKRKLTWPSGAHALVFSSHEPDQLRGPQFDAAWCDELASWEYAQETWDNLSFALRLGRRPRAVVTTTPKPIELIRSLPNRPRRPRHKGLNIRQQRQPRPRLLQRDNRPLRRHPPRTAGDPRRAYRRGRRRPLETRVDREGAARELPAHLTNSRLHRPSHDRQAHKLRDRHRRRRGRHAPPASLRPRRRVRTAHPKQHGSQSRPPLRQVQSHTDSRRGQRRRRDGRLDHQERHRAHTAHQDHPGQARQVHQGRTRRRTLRAGPSPPRRTLPRPRGSDVYLDPRHRPILLPRPRRRLVHAVTDLILNRNPLTFW